MHSQLSYGVMVAQQVLVLFVVVRIRLGQQKHTDNQQFTEKVFRKVFHFFIKKS